jgi:cation diffusion facilitator family transporter
MEENFLKQGRGVALKIFFVVAFFSLAKGVVGFLSGSVVLLADAVHSAADAFSTVLVWIGLKISQRKPSQKFPYGYYKAENLTTLLVAGLIFYAGFELIQESILKITTIYDLRIPWIAVSVAFLDAVVMFLVGTYEVKIGRKINAQSLIADGSESRMHLFSSSVVLFGLLASWFNIPYVEGIAGIIISFFIFSVGFTSAKDSIFSLMDVSPDLEIEKKIKKVIKKAKGVENFGGLRLRKSGPYIFGEARIQVQAGIQLKKAHQIEEEIEEMIKAEVPQIDSFLTRLEPASKERIKLAIPLGEDKGLKSPLSSSLSRCPFFAFVDIQKGKISSFSVKKNPYQKKELRAGLSVGRYLINNRINCLLTQEIGPVSFHVLDDNLIKIYKGESENLAEVIQNFLDDKLSRLRQPTTEKK